jgi:hypothetical protein
MNCVDRTGVIARRTAGDISACEVCHIYLRTLLSERLLFLRIVRIYIGFLILKACQCLI